jgi:hypothetical protein
MLDRKLSRTLKRKNHSMDQTIEEREEEEDHLQLVEIDSKTQTVGVKREGLQLHSHSHSHLHHPLKIIKKHKTTHNSNHPT